MAAVLLAGALLCSGCAELIGVDKKALVVGVGLDAAPVPGSFVVTVQYLTGATPGGRAGGVLGTGGPSAAATRAVTLSAQGTNVAEAFRRLRDETDRFLYLGNLGVILVGQELARKGVLAPLDYFVRSGEIAEATQLAVVHGSAATLFAPRSQATGGAALPLYEFLRLAERAYFPVAPNVLWRFLAPSYGHNESTYAPIFEVSPQGRPFREAGTALFLRNRMVGELNGYDGTVLDWLVKQNGFPDAIVRLPGAAHTAALHVLQVRKRIVVLGPADVVLHVRLNTNLREGSGLVLDATDLRPLEQTAAVQIQAQLRQVLDVLQRDRTDVLGISHAVFPRYPSAAANWPATFSHMRLRLSVKVRIFEGGRKT